MAITDVRKTALFNTYSEGGAISHFSAATAANDDLTANNTLTKEDVAWLQQNVGLTEDMLPSTTVTTTETPVEVPSSFPTLDPLRSAQPAIIKEIVDGDTIYAIMCDTFPCEDVEGAGERFRLWHVSAPPAEWKAGATAKAWLETHLPPNTEAYFVVKGEDPYSRKLVIVYKDGININNLMIREGVGRYWEATETDVGSTTGTSVSDFEIVSTDETHDKISSNVSNNWFVVTVKNNGTESNKYYMSVNLADEVIYKNAISYASTIAAGATKQLKIQVPAEAPYVGLVVEGITVTKV
jgi:endonuclease YncB( thermonuclease family)